MDEGQEEEDGRSSGSVAQKACAWKVKPGDVDEGQEEEEEEEEEKEEEKEEEEEGFKV